MMNATDPVLSVRNAQKHFGAVHALKDVSLDAYRGEVLALRSGDGGVTWEPETEALVARAIRSQSEGSV